MQYKNERRRSTEYKYVSEILNLKNLSTYYRASKKINGKMFTISGKTAEDAAISLDRKLIESGITPLLLKPKL